MFNTELDRIGRILSLVLGEPRREFDAESWNEYNCPYCKEENGGRVDKKYNCCVNINETYFHCWRCEESGKISKILKDHGGKEIVNEYYNELKSIQSSLEYKLVSPNNLVEVELNNHKINNSISLPPQFKLFSSRDKDCVTPYNYLKDRGLDDYLINKFKLGYVPWSDDFKMRTRIVIPSYDQYDNLNYYVTRDYTGKQKLKYINAKIDKKSIVFNECQVNWCEDVTLCEGVFDSFVIPNSIPLLGKVINEDFALYQTILQKARANINILLDDDAIDNAKKMYFFLNQGVLKGRVRFISCPSGYDAALFYQKFGKTGIYKLMSTARQLNDNEIL